MRLLILNIYLLILTGGAIQAQINPPDFQCVRNDTLFWELPTNNCGAFISYQIYFSNSAAGPYSLLSTIANSAQTSFFHNNPLGETFYYYMTTDADCPGLPMVSSDTLNNESPEVAPISVVNVNNGLIELNWIPSISPEVTQYIIYRTGPGGTFPIDTVSASMNFYLDLGSNPDFNSESYFVISMDACGNTSIFDLPHFSVFVEAEVNPCAQEIVLDWNRYRNWQNGIAQQELFLSLNNSPFNVIDTIDSSDSTYLFTDTNDGDTYCFYLRTTENGTGISSFSNVRCIDLDIVEPVRTLFLKNVSVNDNNEVGLTWEWNDDAEVDNVSFEERIEGQSFIEVDNYTPFGMLDLETNRIIASSDPTERSRIYRVKTTDVCDTTAFSNEVPTIHLSGFPQMDQTNTLRWTALNRPDAVVQNYEIYRIVDGVKTFTTMVDADVLAYTDAVDISIPEEVNVCYQVIAISEVTRPDGSAVEVLSQSNTTCVEQLSDILVPNAFVPEGINNVFKPVLVFGATVEYQMEIFDRWGKTIFETDNSEEGWTGRNGLKYYPAGVYPYRIRIRQVNGREVEKRGMVALLR